MRILALIVSGLMFLVLLAGDILAFSVLDRSQYLLILVGTLAMGAFFIFELIQIRSDRGTKQ